ncbi:hypothetical protein NC652_020359 [Populus alba x Populus x berolinensis]|nr:hypothetical protein NC652_020355 [Populus alba x Populus x berolinensis]KAJ6909342.1 hypothetical protein NC652_020359 [Populus alba x Populus x berolinensis]
MGLCQHNEGILAAWLARKSGQSYRDPFNLSIGSKHAEMVFPTAVSHLKDGMSYPAPITRSIN